MDFEKMNPLRPREEGKKGLPPPPPPPLWKNSISIFLIFLLFVVGYGLISGGAKKPVEVSLSEIASDVRDGKVDTIEVEGSKLLAKYEDGAEKVSKKEPESGLSETLKNYGVTSEELSAVKVDIKNPSGFGYWLANLAPILIPILFLVILMWYLSRQVKGGGGMQAFSFGQSKARVIYPDDTAQKVTFKDVAGVKEAKEELMEIVDFLKFPKKFLDIGAQIPKGVLLMGAPGTGKTLLARAVAGEAHVPFFHLSGSEFVEMFVGVGASRVRDLFRMVKKEAPAIIFIDEIDAVGRVRGGGVGGGNDEREQTLNQILVEMDGFEPNEKVIVMAATNRPDVLDPALQRPGRFDRRVILELPDLADRKEIIGVHAKKKPLAEDVNLQVVAERTPGFSGADLYSLMNEGAILAARENRKKIGQFDLIRSIEKVMIGPERKSHVLSDKEKRITAYHEGGHALLASLLPYADPVHKISIISRGHAAGYTLKLPLTERRFHTRKEFLDDIVVSLGGYVAELMVFDDLTTGPSNDLQVATNLARSMVARFGMSSEIGPIALETMDGGYLRGASVMERDYSEHVSATIDKEVSKIMNEAMEKAKALLSKHRNVLDAIAEELIAKESLEQKEYETLIKLHGIKLAHPMKDPAEDLAVTHIAPAPSDSAVSAEAPSIPQATTVTHETVETESAHNSQKHKKGKR